MSDLGLCGFQPTPFVSQGSLMREETELVAKWVAEFETLVGTEEWIFVF